MAFRRSIRNRRARRKLNKDFELQLTSMMDILVIIVVFLLKSYSTATNNFTTVAGMQLPTSNSPDIPYDSLQVIITPESITFDGARIVDFAQTAASVGSTTKGGADYAFKPTDLDEQGRRVIPLYDALVKAREKAELLRTKSAARDAEGNPLPFEGVLAVTADQRVNYDTIRRIMYTAATANYKVFRFLALKKEI